MLVLKEYVKEVESHVEIDYYIPLSIKTKENKGIERKKYYWRTGNFKNSLVEIGVDEQNGVLRDITLVAISNVKQVEYQEKKECNAVYGIPKFKLKGELKNHVYDYPCEVYGYLGKDFFMIAFEEQACLKNKLRFGRVCLGFDDLNNLMSIMVNSLTNDEYNELKDGLKL